MRANTRRGRRWLAALAMLAALALLGAACGDDDDDNGDTASDDSSDADDGADPTPTEAADDPTATPAPTATPNLTSGGNLLAAPSDDGNTCTADRVGGEVTLGLARATAALDPTQALGSGVAGGIEIAAIYDTLILYDAANGTYLPHIAESVTVNDDLTEWTVTLRDDVKFGNGDPLTTEAVKFSFERMKTARVSSAGLAAAVTDMEIVDDQTIIFTLVAPSATFLYVLAEDAGNITNPNIVNSMTPEEFNLDPGGAGAGPYTVESFVPGEKLVLKAKDDYWGGPVCIETLTMVYVPGASANYEAFELGELDVTYVRSAPREIDLLNQSGTRLQGAVTNGETVVIFNIAREGTDSAMKDVRLRRAVAAALDPDLINDKIYEGRALAGSALVYDEEGWSPGVPGPAYDEALAESLVAEVMAEGWDGKVVLLQNDAPQEAVDTALLVEGLLEKVGFEVDLQFGSAGDIRNRVITEGSFDLAFFGMSALEDAPTARYTSYQGGNPRNRTGYGSADMDAALAELEKALTREEKKAAMKKIQEVWNIDVPSAILGHGQWLIASGRGDDRDAADVEGIFISRDVTPMFFEAYVAN